MFSLAMRGVRDVYDDLVSVNLLHRQSFFLRLKHFVSFGMLRIVFPVNALLEMFLFLDQLLF